MADVPFLGEFKMATEATGAESGTDYSCNFMGADVAPESNLLDFGPYLCDNFSSQEPGSFSVPITLRMQRLTAAQKLALHANFKARDLMEFKYMPLAGTIDSPTTTNMQWTVQFYLSTPPPIPTVVDEIATWEMTINATGAILDDGASPVTYGTLVSS